MALNRIDEDAFAFLDAFPFSIANVSALALALWRTAHFYADGIGVRARRLALCRAFLERFVLTAANGIDENVPVGREHLGL